MRVARLLVVALAALPVAAPALAADVVAVGTEGAYAPFTFMDDAGQLTGYDVEVMREVGKRAAFEPRFVPTPWDSMFLGLEATRRSTTSRC